MQDQAKPGLDLIWGAENIGLVCNLSARQTFHMLKTKKLPAKKIGGKWVAERGKLVDFFLEDPEA